MSIFVNTDPTERFAGRFGPYGGQYVPETLMSALDELVEQYYSIKDDPSFQQELGELLEFYVGRPTSLYYAQRLTEAIGGARIVLKREDLAHTGAHKINSAVGQVLLARRMGKRRVIAETGAGQHGVATATVCALYGLECVVYMGEQDIQRQSLNVFRMKLLGAEVRPVTSGTQTLKDAINEAIRDWVYERRHYVLSAWLRSGAAPLSVDRKRFSVCHRPGNARTAHKAIRLLARLRRRLCGRW